MDCVHISNAPKRNAVANEIPITTYIKKEEYIIQCNGDFAIVHNEYIIEAMSYLLNKEYNLIESVVVWYNEEIDKFGIRVSV